MEELDVNVYYLEMREKPVRHVRAPRDGLMVLQVHRPSVRYYRFLYNTVGADYHWLSRRKMSDAKLETVLQSPQSEVYVLHVEGLPAGFAELAVQPDEIELVQFGLMPEFTGQRLGKWFLNDIIERVWQRSPERFWLHTCSLDHPAALPMYRKAGFIQYRQEQILREP